MENAKDFLNPCSMMTPGLAGALTMTVANTITLQFSLAERWPPAIALSISFLFGLLVLTAESMPPWRKLAYYIINSLIIFTVAVGSNTLGGTTYAASPDHKSSQLSGAKRLISDLITIPAAHAQPTKKGWCCLSNMVNPASSEECAKWEGQFFPTEEQAIQACQALEPREDEKQQRFFRPWFQRR